MSSTHLAQELWFNVFSFLDFRSLAKTQEACTLFYQIGASNHFWRIQFERHFLHESLYFKAPNEVQDYKQKFKEVIGININGHWVCYTMREHQETEGFLRERFIYVSNKVEKRPGGGLPSFFPTLHATTTTSEPLQQSMTENRPTIQIPTTPTAASISTPLLTPMTPTMPIVSPTSSLMPNFPMYPIFPSLTPPPTPMSITPPATPMQINSLSPATTPTMPSSISPYKPPSSLYNENNNNNNSTNNNTKDHQHKRRRVHSHPPHGKAPDDILFPHGFLGVGKDPDAEATWGDVIVMGCQWGQYNCCVQLNSKGIFRTVYLYEASPSGRVMIGGFFSNWHKLIGMSGMCVKDTPRALVMQVMTHGWSIHNACHVWESLLGNWVVIFTYEDGREQIFTFCVKTQRKMGFTGQIKGVYNNTSEIRADLHDSDWFEKHSHPPLRGHSDGPPEPKEVDYLQREGRFLHFSEDHPTPSQANKPAQNLPLYQAENLPNQASLPYQADLPHQGNLPAIDDDDVEEVGMDEDDNMENDTSDIPGLIGTVTGKYVGLSFYTLVGTVYGKYITCVGQIQIGSDAQNTGEVLRVAPDDYVKRDITMRGHFMEKVLDPKAHANAVPRVEEGTWRAMRTRPSSFPSFRATSNA